MAMTLKRAFTLWANAPRNVVLAAKSREAVQRVLMRKWNDIDLEQFTEPFCRRIFYQSTASLEMKVKAASILVYVLQWGGDHGYCQRPEFELGIAREEHEKAEKDRAQLETPTDSPCEQPSEEPSVKVKPEALARRKAELKARKEPKEETNMEQKKPRGKQPRKICQIDAETLQVIRTYDSCSEGCRATGVKALDRAIKKLQKAGGYYWQYPEDVPTFAERLKQKQETQPAPKPKVDEELQASGKSLVDKFNEDQQMSENMNRERVITKTAPISTASREPLKVFADDDLLAELERRGWQGELHRVQVKTIGGKY